MDFKVGVVGLGYVGLPLAVEVSKHFETVGYDIQNNRIHRLEEGVDDTNEVTSEELEISGVFLTSKLSDLANCNFYILTVPTPVDSANNPDLGPLISATEDISGLLSKGDFVVYESTVFPGCTEEVCVPILEKSGLQYNLDFFCGYSPERINPGDKKHRISSIKKVTSGSSDSAAEIIDLFYNKVVDAGTFKASCIKVAEAAKVIENSQRDINIAFVNELSVIFNKMGIDSLEVLEAASTKWNFLNFRPGLVGGHCIGVDPYYLTYKAEQLGYIPEVILAGRSINDSMGAHVVRQTMKLLTKDIQVARKYRVLVLGFTFKENCPDFRNTGVMSIIKELQEFGVDYDIHDPNVDSSEVLKVYGIKTMPRIETANYDAIILAVAHDSFKKLPWQDIRKQVKVIFDVKGILPKEWVNSRL